MQRTGRCLSRRTRSSSEASRISRARAGSSYEPSPSRFIRLIASYGACTFASLSKYT